MRVKLESSDAMTFIEQIIEQQQYIIDTYKKDDVETSSIVWAEEELQRGVAFKEELKNLIEPSELEPVRFPRFDYLERPCWLFRNKLFSVKGNFSETEEKLLVFDAEEKHRRKIQSLEAHFQGSTNDEVIGPRRRIPEEIRFEVWRRDGGKCCRCGGRENLEYDHIIPVSKGGGTTSRNIELLCERCNRAKGNRLI